jgi:hypothetical protein
MIQGRQIIRTTHMLTINENLRYGVPSVGALLHFPT